MLPGPRFQVFGQTLSSPTVLPVPASHLRARADTLLPLNTAKWSAEAWPEGYSVLPHSGHEMNRRDPLTQPRDQYHKGSQVSRFPLLFQIVSELCSALLGQMLLTTTTNAPNPAHKEIRQRSGAVNFSCFRSFPCLNSGKLGSNPLNWVKTAGVCCFLKSSVQGVWYFKEMAHNFPLPYCSEWREAG